MKLSRSLVFLLSRLILATCMILVLWQGYESIAKFIAKPQSTAYTIEKYSDQKVLPVMTICPSEYDALPEASLLALKECGL